MMVLLVSLDYLLPVIPKYRTASYHGRKHFVFVRTMLALTLLGFVPTIRMQTVGMQSLLAEPVPADSMNPIVLRRSWFTQTVIRPFEF